MVPNPIVIRRTGPADRDAVLATLAEAFARDPLFTRLFGPDVTATRRSSAGMTSLLRFIVTANRLTGGSTWGAFAGERMLGCMLVERPGPASVLRTAAMAGRFIPVLFRLGLRPVVALARGHARVSALAPSAPHHELRMIGVRTTAQGQGVGRKLFDALLEEVLRDPTSCGISLDTENPSNVPLYQHWGFRLLGRFEAAGLDVAVMYRPVRETPDGV